MYCQGSEKIPEDIIDKARAGKEKFLTKLKTLKTPDDYRDFVLSYFFSQEERENMFNIIGLAEMAKRDLSTWPAFQKFFKVVAYREFSKKMQTFQLEQIRLGWLI